MDDIFNTFDWDAMGLTGGTEEEFTEDELELLSVEQDNGKWRNEDLDSFSIIGDIQGFRIANALVIYGSSVTHHGEGECSGNPALRKATRSGSQSE